MSYYRLCPECGAALDPGEVCDCRTSNGFSENQTEAKKANGFSENQTEAKRPLSMLRTLTTARRDMECATRFPPPMITEIKGGFKHHDQAGVY